MCSYYHTAHQSHGLHLNPEFSAFLYFLIIAGGERWQVQKALDLSPKKEVTLFVIWELGWSQFQNRSIL